MRMAVLASGAGSTFEMLWQSRLKSRLNHELILLVTDNPLSGALTVASQAQIPSVCLPLKNFSSYEAWDAALLTALLEARTDFVLLAGFLKKIGPQVLKKFHGRILNTHPSLLPRHGGFGMYGQRVHRAVLEAGEMESGVTIHLIDNHYDKGKILKQVRVPVEPGDTVAALEARVKGVEKEALLELLNQLVLQDNGLTV